MFLTFFFKKLESREISFYMDSVWKADVYLHFFKLD